MGIQVNNEQKTKLDEIRDEFAAQYWDEFVANQNKAHATTIYKDGWDAAMERVKPLIEALDDIAKGYPIDQLDRCQCFNVAKSALEKYRGEKC